MAVNNMFASSGNANVKAGPANANASVSAGFGPSGAAPTGALLSPTHGFGLSFWIGVGGVALLVILHASLPN